MSPVTGERVVTSEGGFNPTWQRHVATYALCADLLPDDGPVLDLGCGIGHSFALLAPRETVGVDIDAAALQGQDRETVVADMRELPFEPMTFAAALAVQSIEHVPDPERVMAAVRDVLKPGGTAIFVTPNRLTFMRPDEIIDPFHYVEYDPDQLRRLCMAWFGDVRIMGIFGSERQLAFHARERRRLDRMLALDPLRLRRFVPRFARKQLYDASLTLGRRRADPAAEAIGIEDFRLGEERVEEALDLVAVCARR
jgi:SAM-dependent methyltransferase